jgi:hypothetical protein
MYAYWNVTYRTELINVLIWLFIYLTYSQGEYFGRSFIWHSTYYTLSLSVSRGKYKRNYNSIIKCIERMSWKLDLMLSLIEHKRETLHENITVMNTGYLKITLSVECFIRCYLIICILSKTNQTMSTFVISITKKRNNIKIGYQSIWYTTIWQYTKRYSLFCCITGEHNIILIHDNVTDLLNWPIS